MNNNPTFGDFVASICDSDERIVSPSKFARAYGIPLQDLAKEAYVHRNTFEHYPDSPQVQRVFRDTLRVLSAASEVRGGVDQAMYWMRNHPIAAFDHRTASTLVSEGRTDAVIGYLRSIASGFVG